MAGSDYDGHERVVGLARDPCGELSAKLGCARHMGRHHRHVLGAVGNRGLANPGQEDRSLLGFEQAMDPGQDGH